jgi:hypothetical protein
MAMAMPRFSVDQAMPFVRQRGQRFGQQNQIFHPYRGLSGFGGEKGSLHTQNVPQIEQIKNRTISFRQGGFLDVDLQPTPAILQMQKLALSHVAMGNDSASQLDLPPLFPSGSDFSRSFRAWKGTAKRVHAQLAKLFELLPSDLH